MENYFIVCTKSVNGKFSVVSNDDRLRIYMIRNDAEKFKKSIERDVPYKERFCVRKINRKDLFNLIK